WALNFILHNTLGGGGTVSLKHDAQGKTLSAAMLKLEINVPDSLLRKQSVSTKPKKRAATKK
ncbi:MAG TPA: hypothetical protein VFA55_09715, partial [Candidatus Kapabacteria bacterium]|nr:hypothetical protein [Candidatus Kapabacteria bacterium]